MNPSTLPQPQWPRRSRLRRWLRHMQYEMSVYRPRRTSRGVDTLVYGLMLMVLVAVVYPVFAKCRNISRQGSCMSNLKLISLSVQQYAEDYDSRLPQANVWMDQTLPYARNKQVYACPDRAREAKTNLRVSYDYAYNSLLSERLRDSVAATQTTPLCYDSRLATRNAYAPGRAGLAMSPQHGLNTSNNMAYLDGHVGRVDAWGKSVDAQQP